MGLDMYFEQRRYINGKKDLETIDPDKIKYVVQEAGYWRKANAVHKWFVDNVQEGEDDCKSYYVSREEMQELLKTVNIVLAGSELVDGEIQNGYTFKDGKEEPIMQPGKYIKDPTVAMELLPTQEGFFFGNTGYNQYYFEDLERTKEVLEQALTDRTGDFYYQSSW